MKADQQKFEAPPPSRPGLLLGRTGAAPTGGRLNRAWGLLCTTNKNTSKKFSGPARLTPALFYPSFWDLRGRGAGRLIGPHSQCAGFLLFFPTPDQRNKIFRPTRPRKSEAVPPSKTRAPRPPIPPLPASACSFFCSGPTRNVIIKAAGILKISCSEGKPWARGAKLKLFRALRMPRLKTKKKPNQKKKQKKTTSDHGDYCKVLLSNKTPRNAGFRRPPKVWRVRRARRLADLKPDFGLCVK